ncbi:hypothetical protein AM669_11865, partial [Staphylococcus aureus]
INIDIPVLEEQEKIGDFFKKMDILISKQKMKIEILEKRETILFTKKCSYNFDKYIDCIRIKFV